MTFTFKALVNDHIDATRKVGEATLTLRASEVRRQALGVSAGTHATVRFYANRTFIWSDTMNVDDGAKRHAYANQLYGTTKTPGKLNAPAIVSEFTQDLFEHEFMVWADTLWNAWLGSTAGSLVKGDTEPSAPPWAVPGLVMQGSPGIIAGDAGSGKSTLLRLTCQSIHYGIDSVVPIRVHEPTLWVNAEESPQEHTRQLGNVNAALGLARDTPMFTVDARGMSITDLAVRLRKTVREQKTRHVFVDSLSRLAQGMNLNDNSTATTLMDSLSGLECSVTWIGHTGHQNTGRLGGSRHFENAGRVMVIAQSRMSIGGVSPELKRGVRARVYKANGAAPTAPMLWTLEFHRQYGLASARLADPDEWPVLRCGQFVDKGTCGRKTWDGVNRVGETRCSRHRDDEDTEE